MYIYIYSKPSGFFFWTLSPALNHSKSVLFDGPARSCAPGVRSPWASPEPFDKETWIKLGCFSY